MLLDFESQQEENVIQHGLKYWKKLTVYIHKSVTIWFN